MIELREADKVLKYSPVDLFKKSQDYEDTINDFVEYWEEILQQ